MNLGLFLACIGVFLLLVIAYIPASIAAKKDRSFGLWYCYGFLLWPVAFFHARALPQPDYFTLKKEEKTVEEEHAPDDIETIVHFEEFLYRQTDLNAPVDLLSYQIYRGFDGKPYLHLSLRNLCYGSISSLLLTAEAKDKEGKELLFDGKNSFSIALEHLDLPKGTDFHPSKPILLPSEKITRLSLTVTEAFFRDAASIQNESPCPTEYRVESLADYEQVLALKAYTGHAVCLPQHIESGWICICGRLNRVQDARCVFCENEQAFLFKACTAEQVQETAKKNIEQRRLTSEENKRKLAERAALEQQEAELRYAEIAERKARHRAKLRRRRNILLGAVGGLIAAFGLTLFTMSSIRSHENATLAEAAQAKQLPELARDYYGLAGVSRYQSAIEQLQLNEHGVNADPAVYAEQLPKTNDLLPNGAFICDIYDDKILFRNSNEGMDKKVYLLDGVDSEPQFLVEYEEKARGYCCIANDFVTIESNRVGGGCLRFTDLESGEQQVINFADKALAVSKTKSSKLLVYYKAEYDQSINFFEVSQDLFGRWSNRRILRATYEREMQDVLYHVSTVEES